MLIAGRSGGVWGRAPVTLTEPPEGPCFPAQKASCHKKKNSVPDNTMDTGETLAGERNDTSTPQDTVSADKDNKTN